MNVLLCVSLVCIIVVIVHQEEEKKSVRIIYSCCIVLWLGVGRFVVRFKKFIESNHYNSSVKLKLFFGLS